MFRNLLPVGEGFFIVKSAYKENFVISNGERNLIKFDKLFVEDFSLRSK